MVEVEEEMDVEEKKVGKGAWSSVGGGGRKGKGRG